MALSFSPNRFRPLQVWNDQVRGGIAVEIQLTIRIGREELHLMLRMIVSLVVLVLGQAVI